MAAGKSSVLSAIERKRPDWRLLPEPIERFEETTLSDGSKCNWLKNYYDEMRRDEIPEKFRALQARLELKHVRPTKRSPATAFSNTQMQVIISLLERYQKTENEEPDRVIVQERSIQAARRVFLENGKHLLSAKDFTQLRDLCLIGEKAYEKNIKHIFLKVSSFEMLDRIRERGRPSERNIS